MKISKVLASLVLTMIIAIPCIFGGCNLFGNTGLRDLTAGEIKETVNSVDTKLTTLAESGVGVNTIDINNSAKVTNETSATSSMGLPYSLYEDGVPTLGHEEDMQLLKELMYPIKLVVNSGELEFKPYQIYVDNSYSDTYLTCMVSYDISTRTIRGYYSVARAELQHSYDSSSLNFDGENIGVNIQLTEDYTTWESVQFFRFTTYNSMNNPDQNRYPYDFQIYEIFNDIDNENGIDAFNYLYLDYKYGISVIDSVEFNNNKHLDIAAHTLSEALQEQLYNNYFADKFVFFRMY